MKYVGFILANLLLTVTATAHGISDADKQGILEGGNLEYIKLGASHMLTGYDHLLFLFGVMFFLTRFGDIVKFITAFTVGHCVTLVFVTLFLMQLHGYQHTRFTDDFPMNKDEHFQIHENMDRNRDPGTEAGTNTTQETLPQNRQQ